MKNYNQKLKTILIFLIIFFGVLVFIKISSAAIIFSENYDGMADWNCSMTLPPGWTSKAACDPQRTIGGVAHYNGEITSGGRTGKSLKIWRDNGGTTGYGGGLGKSFTTAEFNNNYKALYVRYYVRFDPGWDATSGHKAARFYIGTAAGVRTYGQEFLMNFGQVYTPIAQGTIEFYAPLKGPNVYTADSIAQLGLLDGNWHSLELYFKMNSATAVADGELRFWFDGVEKLLSSGDITEYGVTDRDWGFNTNEYIETLLAPGIGNLSLDYGQWNFPTSGWYKAEFDDYVVSTSYIGPDGTPPPPSDTTPPAAPTGVEVI